MLDRKNRNLIIQIFRSVANIDNADHILTKYEEMVSEFRLNNFENVLVKGGKFIENFYQFLDYIVRKNIASKPNLSKIRARLETAVVNKNIPVSLKSLVADSLHIGYKFRNSRDGAHISDIIANKIDAKYLIEISKWSIAEIIRLYSSLRTDETIKVIDNLLGDPFPYIEKFDDKILVLHELSATNEILTILLFAESNKMDITELKNSIKLHSNSNIITSLRNLEKKRLIYRNNGNCYLTNKGKKKIIEFLKTL